MATETKQILYNVRVNTANGKVKIDGLTRGFIDASRASDLLKKKIADTNNELNKNINKTGLAGAAVTELGRTISDSNYGFTAMANNISQLGTLFATLVSTTKGVGNGLKAMGQALMGPLGVIVAFQVVIAVIEKFAMANKKAKKESEDLNKELAKAKGLIFRLEHYKSILDDTTASIEKQTAAMRSLKKDGYDATIGSIDDYIKARSKVLEFNVYEASLSSTLQESIVKEINLRAKLAEDAEATAKRIEEAQGLSVSTGGSTVRITKEEVQQQIKEEFEVRKNSTEEEIKKLQDAVTRKRKIVNDEYDKAVAGLQGNKFLCLMFGDCKKEEEIKADLSFVDKTFDALFAKLEKKFRERISGNKTELSVNDIIDFTVGDAEDQLEVEQSVQAMVDSVVRPLKEKLEKIDNFKKYVNIAGDLVDAAAQREIATEKNKTNAINNELKARLRNEQLSTDQRKAIQNQIAQNDEALRRKQDKIARARFRIEKAFKLATAIADVAGNSIKARASQYTIPSPDSPFRAKAAQVLERAAGYAQIAIIAAQKYESSASAMTGGVSNVSTGGGIQAPDFNIVGQSQTNLLAQAVGSQLSQPIKAYMVSKDVTTAQEMERNTIGDASLG
jgi:hypothetical protein